MIETRIANEVATGAPASITIGGKLFPVPQPVPQDMAAIAMELANIHERRRGAAVLEYFREFKNLADAKALVLEMLGPPPVVGEDGKVQLTLRAMMAEAGSIEGARIIVYMMLRKHPEVTPEWVAQQVNDTNAAALGVDLLIACGLGRVAPNSPGENGSISSSATMTTPPGTGSASAATANIPPG